MMQQKSDAQHEKWFGICVCVPNKISRLLVLTLIVNFRVSLHSPLFPLLYLQSVLCDI